MLGGFWKIVCEDFILVVVRFKVGSIEFVYYYIFGYDLIVMSGNKIVWNLMMKEKFDFKIGDFLYIFVGDLYRVVYYEDMEFFFWWDGYWDIIFDEDIEIVRVVLFVLFY